MFLMYECVYVSTSSGSDWSRRQSFFASITGCWMYFKSMYTTEFGVATGYCNNQNECVPGADCSASDEGATCDSGFGQGSLSGICTSGVCVDLLCAAASSTLCTSGSVVCRLSTGYCVSFSGAAQCHYPRDENANTCSAEGGLTGACVDGFCKNGPISIPGCSTVLSKISWTKDGINYEDCDDDNQCTTDTCNSELGCFHNIREGGGCNDGEEWYVELLLQHCISLFAQLVSLLITISFILKHYG